MIRLIACTSGLVHDIHFPALSCVFFSLMWYVCKVTFSRPLVHSIDKEPEYLYFAIGLCPEPEVALVKSSGATRMSVFPHYMLRSWFEQDP